MLFKNIDVHVQFHAYLKFIKFDTYQLIYNLVEDYFSHVYYH
jgi:hypothetical protein